ncbi:MAG: ATP-binding protein [Spirochaetales bacterium]|nr:ATP-binding protein [Spirochaetales bacterium]
MENRIKLLNFNIIEEDTKNIEFQLNNIELDDFNLLIGDNAQGKSRSLRAIAFFSKLVSENPKIISTHLKATFNFTLLNSIPEDKICYNIEIFPNGQKKNKYIEEIIRNDTTIFSSKEKENILFNEKEKKEIKDFYISEYISAISSITESGFFTISLVRNFFQRIVLISAIKSRTITNQPDSVIPNEEWSNIASVMQTWKKSYPDEYREILMELKDLFSFIKDFSFREAKFENVIFPMMVISENNMVKDIIQTQWSDGIYRALNILLSPKIPFEISGVKMTPSLILIDEIENGLDYKTLKKIIKYLIDYSEDMQIIITSHSPLVCELVHPDHWRIIKRNKSQINALSPREIESDLKSEMDLFQQKHWDFYTKHIGNSEKYNY